MRTAQNHFPYLAEVKNDVYYICRSWMGLVHDSQFAAIGPLPRGPNDLFIDVGANRGQSILAIRRFRPDAQIISFEPNPVIFQHLKRKFGGVAGVSLREMGLGEQHRIQTLYVPSYKNFVYDGNATFAADKATAYLNSDNLFFFDPAKVSVTEMRCETVSLDSLDLQPTFIKIDVEGSEDKVLAGAMETLRRHQPILMIEGNYNIGSIREVLGKLGYIEVVWEKDRGFSPGISNQLNMFWMTPARLASLTAH